MKDKIPQQASIEYFQKWKEIRKFNITLPDSLKIRVVGIDKKYDDNQSNISRDSAMVRNLNQYIKQNSLQDEKILWLVWLFSRDAKACWKKYSRAICIATGIIRKS